MLTRKTALLAAFALVAGAGTVSAQAKAQTRDGFWVSFGVGGGSGGMTCDGCEDTEREIGSSGYLRMGGTITPQLLVGGESHGWLRKDDNVTGTMNFLSAVAQYYPVATNGMFVKGGLGFSMFSLDDEIDEIETNGFAVQAGVGYDWRLGQNFSLTPHLNYLHSLGGEMKVNGSGTGVDAGNNVIQFGLGFTWH